MNIDHTATPTKTGAMVADHPSRPLVTILDGTSAAAAFAALIALGGSFSEYWLQVATTFLINIILVTSYRLITTMGGWSFAHIAFAGIGAYTMALLATSHFAFSPWLGLAIGPLMAAAIALCLSYPILRTRQYNFFLSTFAAAAAIQQSLIQFSTITGGSNGIAFLPRPGPMLGLSFESSLGFFWLVVTITVAVVFGLYILNRSRIGRTIEAISLNEQLSESLGVFCWGYRALAFVVGSSAAGLAGVLLANFNSIVNPSDFGPVFMFKIVAAAIVGGTRTFFGPLLGLIFLTALEEIFRNSAQYIPLLWGGSIIAALLLTKGGFETLFIRASGRMKRGGRNA